MTVSELIEVLRGMDQDKLVMMWNCEWDSKDHIDDIEVDKDGDVVLS
jgi:hypothetical protein